MLPGDLTLVTEMFGYEMTPVRIDKLSLVWGYVFISLPLSIIINGTNTYRMGGLSYAGAAIGAAFAGDLITLFAYWGVQSPRYSSSGQSTPEAGKVGTVLGDSSALRRHSVLWGLAMGSRNRLRRFRLRIRRT